jgi:PEP-CTERM motif
VELTLLGHLDVKTKLSNTLSTKLSDAWNGGVKLLFPTKTSLPTTLEVETKISALKLVLNSPLTPASTKATLQGQITLLTSFKDVLSLQSAVNAYTGQIGASEIAKVVTGGKTYYAYSFNATASGITASDDGVSYSGIYTWNTPGYTAPTPPPTPVPEPSVMLGLLGVAGVFATRRKFKKASI